MKSKSVVNWPFILWNTGSWTVACARLASDSEAALAYCPPPLTELLMFSETHNIASYTKNFLSEAQLHTISVVADHPKGKDASTVGCSSFCMCMMREHRHMGSVALMEPAVSVPCCCPPI
ncbi:hypothetical protein E2C01_010473 [Portunus trituberculatus]|uniref:Uncharacterized protein n=1 Tax=Portunus trituberculatus TaxID=210409 RepID=A0A5B7D8J4_PORTR|nr:hypothetical protein [Portunus trituberculatus]